MEHPCRRKFKGKDVSKKPETMLVGQQQYQKMRRF